jgi:acyl-CoA synthetase (AMP-forming)/AMP-acid ligase II
MNAIPRAETQDYDLSRARILLNGAEPIDPRLVSEFGRHFGASGLAPQAMTPGYGLAEATLGVSFMTSEAVAQVEWLDRDRLNDSGAARPVNIDDDNARGVVSCGAPVPGIQIRITAGSVVLPDRRVGEIEVRGDSVMDGYYRESVPSVLPGGWYPTGDLGYLADGHLYVTGRRKEMLVIGGRNYYPQDIEDAVRRVPGVYHHHAVAVILPEGSGAGGPERIVVLAESAATEASHADLLAALRDAASTQLDGASVEVLLVRRGTLPRTTSGKFQRLLVRERLLRGTLEYVIGQLSADDQPPARQPASPCVA